MTTAADLNRFDRALLDGRLLPPAMLRQMKAVTAPSETGLGLEVLPLPACGETAYGHSGALGASAWTFATADRAVSLSVTWGTNRPARAAVTALLTGALCP